MSFLTQCRKGVAYRSVKFQTLKSFDKSTNRYGSDIKLSCYLEFTGYRNSLPGQKLPVCDVDRSVLSRTKFKLDWNCTSAPPV
jgi:hypothetical protein